MKSNIQIYRSSSWACLMYLDDSLSLNSHLYDIRSRQKWADYRRDDSHGASSEGNHLKNAYAEKRRPALHAISGEITDRLRALSRSHTCTLFSPSFVALPNETAARWPPTIKKMSTPTRQDRMQISSLARCHYCLPERPKT